VKKSISNVFTVNDKMTQSILYHLCRHPQNAKTYIIPLMQTPTKCQKGYYTSYADTHNMSKSILYHLCRRRNI